MTSDRTTLSEQPLVSVLTPVYNGEAYLAECIESVLGQTYRNWEYIIVNNCSTDHTLEIASAYARQDPRIRIVSNSEFVSPHRNHNTALTLISPESKYCKFVQADDVLFPSCLSEMVRVAETHPSVGIVGSYQLWDRWVRCDGLPYPSTVIRGREVCRQFFLQKERGWFGTMSAFLLRADLVRSRTPFLNEEYLFNDTEVYVSVLQNHDYGFVHQVLSFRRVHENALSSFGVRHNEWTIAILYLTKTYGRGHLTPGEYEDCLKQAIDEYYRYQGRELLRLREKSFWKYHHRMMNKLGFSFSPLRVLKGAMLEVADVFLGPFRFAGRQLRLVIGSKTRIHTRAESKR